MTKPSIGVVGATGAVGRRMLSELDRLVGLDSIDCRLFASERSAGLKIEIGIKSYVVEVFSVDCFKEGDIVLMSAGGEFSREFSPRLKSKGVTVIDNSSAFRMSDDVSLVVPEVNSDEISVSDKGQIIANPNCSTIQMVAALKPLYDSFGISEINVSTYQSVSGSGQNGISELKRQISELPDSPKEEFYASPIAFNIIPAIDVFDEAGHCFEEEKMIRETKKIFSDQNIFVMATTVRVPTYYCHGESVSVKLKKEVSIEQVVSAFKKSEGLVVEEHNSYDNLDTCLSSVNQPEVYVSRIRLPLDEKKSDRVQMWVIADNLLKGAATNAVQILKAILDGRNR